MGGRRRSLIARGKPRSSIGRSMSIRSDPQPMQLYLSIILRCVAFKFMRLASKYLYYKNICNNISENVSNNPSEHRRTHSVGINFSPTFSDLAHPASPAFPFPIPSAPPPLPRPAAKSPPSENLVGERSKYVNYPRGTDREASRIAELEKPFLFPSRVRCTPAVLLAAHRPSRSFRRDRELGGVEVGGGLVSPVSRDPTDGSIRRGLSSPPPLHPRRPPSTPCSRDAGPRARFPLFAGLEVPREPGRCRFFAGSARSRCSARRTAARGEDRAILRLGITKLFIGRRASARRLS